MCGARTDEKYDMLNEDQIYIYKHSLLFPEKARSQKFVTECWHRLLICHFCSVNKPLFGSFFNTIFPRIGAIDMQIFG